MKNPLRNDTIAKAATKIGINALISNVIASATNSNIKSKTEK